MKNTAYPTVRIVAAVVDTARLTIYKENGSPIFIAQGDPNLRRIVDEATPQLLHQGWADIHLEPVPENSYAHFEKESSGVVRFFKIAKHKLKELLVAQEAKEPDTRPMTEMSIGKVPTPVLQTEFPSPALGEEPMPALKLENKPPVIIPTSLISAAADAIEEFGEDELERYRDEQQAKKEQAPIVVQQQAWPFPDPKPAPVDDLAGVYASTGTDEVADDVTELVQVEEDADTKRMTSAVDEILQHAMPVSDPNFTERGVAKQGQIVEENGYTKNHVEDPDAPETIIAVVGDKVIPGVERIKSQFARAAKLGSTIGVENFMKRLAAVIDQRAHSIDELLNFLERADLPIADDGTILIYKVLKRKGDRTGGKYVDCRTGKVDQWTGAYVCMDPSMVDMNRRTECSVGLHVARRGYVRNFSGNVCVLGKLAPEDVIAVPHGEANKLRACGYHLIMELTDAQYGLIKQNKPLSDDPEGKILLANAIAGRHVRITHRVEIRAEKGGNVVVTEIGENESPVPPAPVPVAEDTAVVEAEALLNSQVVLQDDPVDPVGVAKEVTKVVEEQQLSRKEQAGMIYATWKETNSIIDKDRLFQFKKASKVSWDKLGITDPVFTMPAGVPIGRVDRKKEPKVKTKAPAKKTATVKAQSKPVKEKNVETSAETKPVTKVVTQSGKITETFTTVDDVLKSYITSALKIQALQGMGMERPEVAKAILQVKKAAKKAWGYFGISDDVASQIMAKAKE